MKAKPFTLGPEVGSSPAVGTGSLVLGSVPHPVPGAVVLAGASFCTPFGNLLFTAADTAQAVSVLVKIAPVGLLLFP